MQADRPFFNYGELCTNEDIDPLDQKKFNWYPAVSSSKCHGYPIGLDQVYKVLTSSILEHKRWVYDNKTKIKLSITEEMEYHLLYTIISLTRPEVCATCATGCYNDIEPSPDVACYKGRRYTLAYDEAQRLANIVDRIRDEYIHGRDVIMDELMPPQNPFLYIDSSVSLEYGYYWGNLHVSTGDNMIYISASKDVVKDKDEISHLDYLDKVCEKAKKYREKIKKDDVELHLLKGKPVITDPLDKEKYSKARSGYKAVTWAVLREHLPDDRYKTELPEIKKMEYWLLYTIISLSGIEFVDWWDKENSPGVFLSNERRKQLTIHPDIFIIDGKRWYLYYEEVRRIANITQWIIEKYKTGQDVIMNMLRGPQSPFFYIDDEVDQIYTCFWRSMYYINPEKIKDSEIQVRERRMFSQIEYLERIYEKLTFYTQKCLEAQFGKQSDETKLP